MAAAALRSRMALARSIPSAPLPLIRRFSGSSVGETLVCSPVSSDSPCASPLSSGFALMLTWHRHCSSLAKPELPPYTKYINWMASDFKEMRKNYFASFGDKLKVYNTYLQARKDYFSGCGIYPGLPTDLVLAMHLAVTGSRYTSGVYHIRNIIQRRRSKVKKDRRTALKIQNRRMNRARILAQKRTRRHSKWSAARQRKRRKRKEDFAPRRYITLRMNIGK